MERAVGSLWLDLERGAGIPGHVVAGVVDAFDRIRGGRRTEAGEAGGTGRIRVERGVGSLGSVFYRMSGIPRRMVAGVAREFDGHRIGRRMEVNVAEGFISWMSPSSDHEGLARASDRVVDALAGIIGIESVPMGSTRWKGRPGDPEGTGMEADAAFYVGDNAGAWRRADEESEAAVLEFEVATPPDLVVEVEMSHFDRGKVERYAGLGVTEMWQVTRGTDRAVAVSVLDLQADTGPERLAGSALLPGLSVEGLAQALGIARRRPATEVQAHLETLLGDGAVRAREGNPKDSRDGGGT